MADRRRKHNRYTRRLEVEFKVGERVIRGISSNISEHGIFVRTSTPLSGGSFAEVTIHLPDGTRSVVSGTVRRAVRSAFAMVKNGMGVEITSRDDNFLRLLKDLGLTSPVEQEEGAAQASDTESAPSSSEPQASDPLEQAAEPAAPEPPPTEPKSLIVECPSCGAKNRVRIDKLLSMVPRCGRCHTELQVA